MKTINENFMSPAYSRIQEPLNLLSKSQTWLKSVHERHLASHPKGGAALVLGATPWLVMYCSEHYDSVIASDMSLDMLEKTRRLFIDTGKEHLLDSKIKLLQANWQMLPDPEVPYAFVVGDNSLPFVPYKHWQPLLGKLRGQSAPGALFLHRFFAAPTASWLAEHSNITCISAKYKDRTLSSTALRATLMFSKWNIDSGGLDVESAAQVYEQNKKELHELIAQEDAANEDLSTIKKYQGTGLQMAAPSFQQILEDLSLHFEVKTVDYGDYPLREFFPLISSICV